MQATSNHITLSPSDVTAFLACRHLTTLALREAHGNLARPEVENEQRDLIFRKGLDHELAYLQRLRDEGNTVCEIARHEVGWERAAAATVAAMRDGVDVVYQGALV